ncbi:hypothetical protein J8F10_19175 [Gemmata sp. G18]|uniref:YCII-related domain-containing protein n=1 Tax=Gemmata palustris TaxID=2822762 RepID=A0ABS5BWW0_9BACT|nr:YciI family protein [Gemmata palustris]MBP3957373.1 hypothetical protein [Gemmata palustris]
MKYMLLIYSAESCWIDEERTACMVDSLALCDELAARGQFIDASPLEPVTTAVTVRVRDGQTLVTDGPFAETTEQLGGYFVLDLADLDEAIAVATRLPPVTKSTVEIRPLFVLDGLPPAHPVSAGEGKPGATFLMLCYDDEGAWRAAGPTAQGVAMAEAAALCRELSGSGAYLSAAPLHPVETATCVRVRDGRRVITDGPFAETHEVLGGYYLIRAESRDAVARIAERHPGVRVGAVEVRPVFDLSGLRKRA